MSGKTVWTLACVGLFVWAPRAAQAQITDAQVRRAIEQGVRYLKAKQNPNQGNWVEQTGYPGGVSSLCTLALLNCGVPPDDPCVRKALEYVRGLSGERRTYTVALQTMVLCAAEPRTDRLLIRDNVAWLQRVQLKQGDRNGSWTYDEGAGPGDPSNTQFALLALYEAERVGVEVQRSTWVRSRDYWLRRQTADGGWSYQPGHPSTGSMTSAGIASLIITTGQVSPGDARVVNGSVDCCAPQEETTAVDRGLDWLARHFSVRRNPSHSDTLEMVYGRTYFLYYMYGLERVGRLTGHRFIGQHDWYREGAEELIKLQDPLAGSWVGEGVEKDPTVGTALALLFLSKGRRPILVSKLRYTDTIDWNRHRHDLHHLTPHVEGRWRREMTWQTIDLEAARVEDLLQSPVLFLSGRDGLRLTAQQKQALREYVLQGGFLFAEACCGGAGFDRDFRQLVSELFPDSPLRPLPPDHPVWYAEQKVNPDYMRPLLGVEACCRTSVVYCPDDLSCYWELADRRTTRDYPQPIQDEIEACLAIGANVLTYATGRELREKLDAPDVVPLADSTHDLERGTLYVAKVNYGAGSDDAPAALTNLLAITRSQLEQRVGTEKRLIPLTDATLVDYPIAFMHGRREFRLTDDQREALAQYLARGGFLLADSICASAAFSESFRREINSLFPDRQLQPVPSDHPLLTPAFQGFDITRVSLRDPRTRSGSEAGLAVRRDETHPILEALELDGRYAVIFSPYDLSCALETRPSLDCKGYSREDAARIGINVLLYAMQN